MDAPALIRHWRFRVHRVQLAHYNAGRRHARFHLWLGLPVIILGTIVGTSVFATLQQTAEQQSASKGLQITVGLLSVASAILASLQTFLNYATTAEKHRIAGARFASLKHQIELLATMPPTDRAELRAELLAIDKQWATYREDSPNIPQKIWRRIEETLTLEEHESRYPEFAATLADVKDIETATAPAV